MTITGIVPYFGGKRSLSRAIVAEICNGTVPQYFAEPFCGSMAVSLAMPDVPTHTVNDLHGGMINFARVLAGDAGPELVDRLRRTLCAESLYLDAVAAGGLDGGPAPETPDPERAWAFAVASWLGPNGSAQGDGARFCVRFGPGGGDPATRLRSATDAMGEYLDRLRRLTILNRDGFEVLASVHDAYGVAIYVDPPYLRGTRGDGGYIHDFSDHGGGIFSCDYDDHDRLADALRRFTRARVVVSYYDHPRLDDLYRGWTKVTLGASAGGIGNASGDIDRDRVEVLLVNEARKGTR